MKLVHPTDFSDCADAAQAVALRLARRVRGEVVLLHVAVEAPLHSEGPLNRKAVRQVYAAQRKWAMKTLEERTAAIRKRGVAARWLLRSGVPAEEIAKASVAEAADLVVLGTHGRAGLERALLGSVADRVIRTAPCPVLTVRVPEP
jgi:nucleotide-binding universal stress UspA family protein